MVETSQCLWFGSNSVKERRRKMKRENWIYIYMDMIHAYIYMYTRIHPHIQCIHKKGQQTLAECTRIYFFMPRKVRDDGAHSYLVVLRHDDQCSQSRSRAGYSSCSWTPQAVAASDDHCLPLGAVASYYRLPARPISHHCSINRSTHVVACDAVRQ